jgi:hypothetical protein
MDSRKRRSVAQADPDLEAEFHSLVKQWKADTETSSLVQQQVQHPAYQRIIHMGPRAVPLILDEMRRCPDHWFWALHAITGEQPASAGSTFSEAADAWLAWGRARGLIG